MKNMKNMTKNMKYLLFLRTNDLSKSTARRALNKQKALLLEHFGHLPIAAIVEEIGSAKAVNRPVFASVMDRIEAGEINGLITLGPGRLARNAPDSARLEHLRRTGQLKDIRFLDPPRRLQNP